MPNEEFVILMTCVGGALVPQNIMYARQSRKHNIRVIGVDAQDNAIGRHFVDAYYQIPVAQAEHYIEKMLEISQKENVSLIIPGSDEESLILAKHRTDFESAGTQVANADYETLQILNDKSKTYEALRHIPQIHLPIWYEAKERDDILSRVQEIHDQYGSVVIKPTLERGGRGVVIVSEHYKAPEYIEGGRQIRMNMLFFKEQHLSSYHEHHPLMVMQNLVDPVHDVDILSMKGEAHRIIPRRRVNSMEPNSGHVLIQDNRLIEMAKIVVKHFNLSWLQDIDVMFDDQGIPFILEVNPRPSGSYAVTVSAGCPLIDDMVSLAKGEPLDLIEIRYNQTILPYKALKAYAT